MSWSWYVPTGLGRDKQKPRKTQGQVQRGRTWRRPKDNIKMNEVFTFWDVTQRWLVLGYRRFGTSYRPHVKAPSSRDSMNCD